MSESTVAIIGAGVVGTAIASVLVNQGHDVVIFEKGPEYPYPHNSQFTERIRYRYNSPKYKQSEDLKNLTVSGDYKYFSLNNERIMLVGGSATRWEAITLRMTPSDFKTRSKYGYGKDWPVSYDDLEPYYCEADQFLGVSGTDKDNPFAPRRSRPYPMPPFELSYDDSILAERLQGHDIILHTTPQARTRTAFGRRPACQNFGTCYVCPIGARYSPNYHLLQAKETGLLKVYPNVSVKRIITDGYGKAQALVYQSNDAILEEEHAAKIIIVACGAIESTRLLLLSDSDHHPNGLGNDRGHVGQHFLLHHAWFGYQV